MEPDDWLTAAPGQARGRVPEFIGKGMDEPGVQWQVHDKATGSKWPDVCPGWAVRQPLIVECAQAHVAFEKSAMDALYPHLSQAVAEGVTELVRAYAEYARQQIAGDRKRAERNG